MLDSRLHYITFGWLCFSEWVSLCILNFLPFLKTYHRKTHIYMGYFISVSFWRHNSICNPVTITITCNDFCTELGNQPAMQTLQSQRISCSESCPLHLYIVNGTFCTNYPVLRGQLNVSFFWKADSLLFSSCCVGQAPTVLELEQTGHSRRAAKDCVLVRLLHL